MSGDDAEREAQEREIGRLSRFYAVLSRVNQGLVRCHSREELFTWACRAAAGDGGFKLAWIGWHEPENRLIRPVARSGEAVGYLDRIAVSTEEIPSGLGPVGRAFREGWPVVIDDFLGDAGTAPWHRAAAEFGLATCAAFPIRAGGQVGGILAVYAGEAGVFGPKEVTLLEQVAADISFGLDNLAREAKRQEAEESLRESEARFRTLIEQAPDAVFVHAGPGFAYLNAAALRLFGADSAGQLLGRPVLERVDPASRELVRERIRRSVEEGLPNPLHEHRYLRLDGTPVPVEVAASPVAYRGARGAIVFARDVSERRLLEDRLRQSQKMEAIGQLASGVAHDYNNILTAILVKLGLLLDDPQVAPGVKSSLRELQHAGERAAGLTRQLLLFGRAQAIQMKPLDLNGVASSLAGMLKPLLGELVTLELQVGDAPLGVEADRGMVEQVLINLCVNARDAMLPRGGRLTVSAKRVELGPEAARRNPEARAGAFARLSVADTGCGMDSSVLRRLFEPFFTTKEEGRGTGLGLAAVYSIAKQHQGWVEVQSEVGRGSTFHVHFPVTDKAAEPEQRPAPAEPGRGSETILLVEDEELVRQTVAATLRWYGYRVLEAADGQEAVRVWEARAGEIDLLFSDMVMPGGMTGLELLGRFRKERAELRAVISSGYGAVLAGSKPPVGTGLAYLAKPYAITTLASTVRACLDLS